VADPTKFIEYMKSNIDWILEPYQKRAWRLLYSKECDSLNLKDHFENAFETIYNVPGWTVGWRALMRGTITAGLIGINTPDHSVCNVGNCPVCFIGARLP
jgi:hypothetical protein